jgi:hypothetical protein
MDYEVSQKLINILLLNGFSDYTNTHFPEYWAKLEAGKPYYPKYMNRAFGLGSYAILFENGRIIGKRSPHVYFNARTVSDRQIRSLLFYFTLTPRERNYFVNMRQNPFSIGDFLERTMRYLEYDRDLFRKKIIFFKERFDKIPLALRKSKGKKQKTNLYTGEEKEI